MAGTFLPGIAGEPIATGGWPAEGAALAVGRLADGAGNRGAVACGLRLQWSASKPSNAALARAPPIHGRGPLIKARKCRLPAASVKLQRAAERAPAPAVP